MSFSNSLKVFTLIIHSSIAVFLKPRGFVKNKDFKSYPSVPKDLVGMGFDTGYEFLKKAFIVLIW